MKMIFHLLALITLITACDKTPDPIRLPDLADMEGNQYDGVKIGNQFWLKQNLRTSYYKNGDHIPEITSMSLWSTMTSGAWCWYDNDSIKYAAYGKLYNWYAVNDPRGLAPLGWHIPSYEEWETLSMSLGGDLLAGGTMKETGTRHWISPNTGATNSSGFTGLPGGSRSSEGNFSFVGINGYWWGSTEFLPDNALSRNLDYSDATLLQYFSFVNSGLSVRLISD